MNLPDLQAYRQMFLDRGTVLPLPVVSNPGGGLLQRLPPPPSGRTGWPWTMEYHPLPGYWPKLTIVTPSFNQGAFIEQTIRSVLLQNYPNLEYIIIDGGSNDGTLDVIKRYAPWVSFWQSMPDGGQGQAINLGFSIASGDYYGWINSDDYYLSGVFDQVIKTFTRSGARFVYGFGYTLNLSTGVMKFNRIPHFTDFFIKIPSLLQPSTFWSAAIHQPVWEELYCALDFELWLRLVKGQKRKLLRVPLSVATMHDDAKTFDPKMKAKWDADHNLIWSEGGHGPVYEWRRISFLNRLRLKVYRLLKLI